MRATNRQGTAALIAALAASHSFVAAWQPSDWTLTSTRWNRTAWEDQPYVANGYIVNACQQVSPGSLLAIFEPI